MSISLCTFVVIVIYLFLNNETHTAINSVYSVNAPAEIERIFSSRASLHSKHSVSDAAEFQQVISLPAVQINQPIIQNAPALTQSNQLHSEPAN